MKTPEAILIGGLAIYACVLILDIFSMLSFEQRPEIYVIFVEGHKENDGAENDIVVENE